jgi:hypothetical protein
MTVQGQLRKITHPANRRWRLSTPALASAVSVAMFVTACGSTAGTSSDSSATANAATSLPSATSSGTATPTPAVSPTRAVTPAPTPASPQTLLNQQGSGTASTASFSTPKNWDLGWSYDCSSFGSSGNFEVDVQGNLGPVGVNQMGTSGSGTEYYHQGGSYYLEVDSECSWQITARAAASGENGAAGLSASGSGSHSTQTFTVPTNWKLAWSYDCSTFGSSGNFVVDVQGASVLGVNELGSGGSGTENYHSGGTVWLDIDSECAWQVKASAA